jgi:hypothetical protein
MVCNNDTTSRHPDWLRTDIMKPPFPVLTWIAELTKMLVGWSGHSKVWVVRPHPTKHEQRIGMECGLGSR